jgi:hypothetical protein
VHRRGQSPDRNGAKPHFRATYSSLMHHFRTHAMTQTTHLKKENKFPLLEMKMKIYLHKL